LFRAQGAQASSVDLCQSFIIFYTVKAKLKWLTAWQEVLINFFFKYKNIAWLSVIQRIQQTFDKYICVHLLHSYRGLHLIIWIINTILYANKCKCIFLT
jgi:hypothetical protein